MQSKIDGAGHLRSISVVLLSMLAAPVAHALDDWPWPEFDSLDMARPELRLSLGSVPSIDRVSSSGSYNGQSVSGASGGAENWYEPDGAFNPSLVLEVVGSGSGFSGSDSSRFGVSLGWARRQDSYAMSGYATPETQVDTYGLSLLYGADWRLTRRSSLETMGRLGGGALRSREYSIDPEGGEWQVDGDGRGAFFEVAIRSTLLYRMSFLTVGAQVEYVAGSGYARWREAGSSGVSEGKSTYTWYGFGGAIVIGTHF
jgi:hypothetical protein